MSQSKKSPVVERVGEEKLRFRMPLSLIDCLRASIISRIEAEREEIPHGTYFALVEANRRLIEQANKKKITLLMSHYFTIFCAETMQYMPEEVRTIIWSYVWQIKQLPRPLPSSGSLYDLMIEEPDDYDADTEYRELRLVSKELSSDDFRDLRL